MSEPCHCGYPREHPIHQEKNRTAQEFSYEADSNGNVYERDAGDGSVWPTGIRVRAWATRNDITRDEFVRHLHSLDERDRL